MPIDQEELARNFIREIKEFLKKFQDKPVASLYAVLGILGTFLAGLDSVSSSLGGGGSESWGESGRPLFGEAFAGLPARILLFFVFVSALSWTFSLVAVFLTSKAGRGRAMASHLWFVVGGLATIAVVDLIFRGVLEGQPLSMLFFSCAAVGLALFLSKAQFMFAMETRASVVAARAHGLMLFSIGACGVAFLSFLPIGT